MAANQAASLSSEHKRFARRRNRRAARFAALARRFGAADDAADFGEGGRAVRAEIRARIADSF